MEMNLKILLLGLVVWTTASAGREEIQPARLTADEKLKKLIGNSTNDSKVKGLNISPRSLDHEEEFDASYGNAEGRRNQPHRYDYNDETPEADRRSMPMSINIKSNPGVQCFGGPCKLNSHGLRNIFEFKGPKHSHGKSHPRAPPSQVYVQYSPYLNHHESNRYGPDFSNNYNAPEYGQNKNQRPYNQGNIEYTQYPPAGPSQYKPRPEGPPVPSYKPSDQQQYPGQSNSQYPSQPNKQPPPYIPTEPDYYPPSNPYGQRPSGSYGENRPSPSYNRPKPPKGGSKPSYQPGSGYGYPPQGPSVPEEYPPVQESFRPPYPAPIEEEYENSNNNPYIPYAD